MLSAVSAMAGLLGHRVTSNFSSDAPPPQSKDRQYTLTKYRAVALSKAPPPSFHRPVPPSTSTSTSASTSSSASSTFLSPPPGRIAAVDPYGSIEEEPSSPILRTRLQALRQRSSPPSLPSSSSRPPTKKRLPLLPLPSPERKTRRLAVVHTVGNSPSPSTLRRSAQMVRGSAVTKVTEVLPTVSQWSLTRAMRKQKQPLAEEAVQDEEEEEEGEEEEGSLAERKRRISTRRVLNLGLPSAPSHGRTVQGRQMKRPPAQSIPLTHSSPVTSHSFKRKNAQAEAKAQQNEEQMEEDGGAAAAEDVVEESVVDSSPAFPVQLARPAPKERSQRKSIPAPSAPLPAPPRTSRTSLRAVSSPPTEAVDPCCAPSRVPHLSMDDNDDFCSGCGGLGNVLCCLYCPQSYHLSCLPEVDGVTSIDDLPDTWQCGDGGKKCTTRTQPQKTDGDLTDAERASFRWTSKCTRRRGAKYYTAFSRSGENYTVGDVVSIHTEDAGDRIGEIDEVWEDLYGERWMNVRWYFQPQETRHGRLSFHRGMEIFATAHMDEVFVDSIQAKVMVLNEAEFQKREGRGEVDEWTYMCRQRYDHDRGEFRPYVPDPSTQAARAKRKATDDGGEDWELDGMGGKCKKRRKDVDTSASEYSRACSALQLSSLPPSLPCREVEERQIRNFLTTAIRRGGQNGGGLYIAGVPGTGKTATVRQVLGHLAHTCTSDAAALESDPSRVPPFQFIEVNGMKLPDPNHAYSHIWHGLTGKRVAPKRACDLLDVRFKAKASRRPVCVLLIDEVDFCKTRSQHLLYHLADWPSYRAARLVTISISNTLDFPTLLHARIQSRFSHTQLTFKPYTSTQIEQIVTARLRSTPGLFDEVAVEFCARKVGSIIGDVRVALEICRRALVIAEEQKGGRGKRGLIGIEVIQRAISDLQDGSDGVLIRRLSLYQMGMLAAVYGENKEVSEFVGMGRVGDRMRRILQGKGMGVELSGWEVEGICQGLVGVGLMEVRWVKGQHWPEVRMTTSPHMCHQALKDNEHWIAMTT